MLLVIILNPSIQDLGLRGFEGFRVKAKSWQEKGVEDETGTFRTKHLPEPLMSRHGRQKSVGVLGFECGLGFRAQGLGSRASRVQGFQGLEVHELRCL